MDLKLKDKVVLITGSSRGIGRATALGFAKGGAKIVLVDRDGAAGEATAGVIRQQGGEARFVAADVTKSAEVRDYVKAALDAYGSIDCFFKVTFGAAAASFRKPGGESVISSFAA